MEILIVTGMSGAGKSKALQCLEDLGYYCIDNLPPQLLLYMLNEEIPAGVGKERIAVTIDIRSYALLGGMEALIEGLRAQGIIVKILFLDASDDNLMKRYQETRRLHPLMQEQKVSSLQEAFAVERKILDGMKQMSDMLIDTTNQSTSALKERIAALFDSENLKGMSIEFVAFGFKYGILPDADLVFDVRCLPNPFYVDELRKLSGDDREVRDYVMSTEEARELFRRIYKLLDYAIPLYQKEGKSQLVIGFGCTGGQHRSLAFAGMMKEKFEKKYSRVKLTRRDTSQNIFEIMSRK